MNNDQKFMQRAIDLAKSAVKHGNEPFGAVLVKNNQIVFDNMGRSPQVTAGILEEEGKKVLADYFGNKK